MSTRATVRSYRSASPASGADTRIALIASPKDQRVVRPPIVPGDVSFWSLPSMTTVLWAAALLYQRAFGPAQPPPYWTGG